MKLLFAFSLTLLSHFLTAQSMGLALEGKEWEGVQAYPITGKSGNFNKQTVVFDGYKTLELDRSWTKGSEVTVGWTEGVPTDDFYRKLITTDLISKKQTLYFSLGDQSGKKSQAFCVSQLDARDFNIGNRPVSALNLLLDLAGPGMESSSMYFTRIFMDDAPFGWDLVIDNQAAMSRPKEYIGYLAKNKDEYYTITPVTRIKSKKGKVGNMPFGASGFEIRTKAGNPLAAVSLIDKGIIYLKEMDAQERLLMATVCTALLLQEIPNS